MQPTRPQQPRGPGGFNPLTGNPSQPSQQPPSSSRPPLRRVESSGSEDDRMPPPRPSITIPKSRPSQQKGQSSSPATPIYAQFASHANSSTSSLQQQHHHFPRAAGSRAVTQGSPGPPLLKGHHARKHSATQGMFEPTLPSTSTSNLSSHVAMNNHAGPPSTSSSAAAAAAAAAAASNSSAAGMSASQIAAQAAVMSHQNNMHSRQRSQTVPFPGDANEAIRRGSGSKAPAGPPMLSLTEASAPRDTGFANHNHGGPSNRYDNSHSSAATAAANVVFPRSGHNSPRGPHSVSPQPYSQHPPPPPPASEKPGATKPKVKLFSRPGKISTKGETKDKPLPSPGKIGSALSALQRGNFSTSSLVEPNNQSMYSLNNSSSATIRPIDSQVDEKEKGKEKEKKHHFLSRQKHKLKDEYHLPLSSAASNSRPTDPNAPNPLYNFNIPPSPGPNSTSFAKAKKDKKAAERSEARLENEGSFSLQSEWPGPSSLPSLSQQSTMYEPVDPGRLGLQTMNLDDAWPVLKAKLLVIFEGEDLRATIEDLNKVVQMHIQWCIHRRSPYAMLEDLGDLLATGFSSLDRTLRQTPEDRFIPTLVELWIFTFTSILPYLQAVFLPLDLEVSGCGTIMTGEQARDFWGGVLSSSSSSKTARVTPAATVLDVRRLVLIAYRDIVILPRYETLKTIFSRLSLEFLPAALGNTALSSPPQEAILSTSPSESFTSMARPGTAMSLDPSVASYNSNSTTLLGEGSAGGRSRAISNVSFGSHASDGALRPFTPSGSMPPPGGLGSVREREQSVVVDDSKHVTDMVGRMLQCMSVLSSLGGPAAGDPNDEGSAKMVELCKMLKLNWLGRGRTGRNRRGIVGGRVRREDFRDELRVA
ncbi:HbrB-like-domain-containing protein [Dactylonectria estremocensis]|uniref:HbrB-like-domain-containing protein n=1 Tax=Dactylonectria estremocensis TaxID=1079267 RepID=A0A9P9J8X3_9HYPO|nr:HbrB-like-domain-containing protein [Dactylonectria estremocensis]